jgi:heptosyltransferase-1
VNRILIVRLGALGDIVHAIPVAAALGAAYPSARIDWIVAARYRELLDLVPAIDRRLAVTIGFGLIGAVPSLRAEKYDAAIDLQGLLISATLARASGAREVVGFSSAHLREKTARIFYTRVHDPGGAALLDTAEPVHVIRTNLSLLEPFGIRVGEPQFPIDPVRSDVADEMRSRTHGRYALLNPGAAWPNKRWSTERFGAVAAWLREKHGLASIVLWGPGEEPLAQAVAGHSSGAARVSPPTSIRDLVALARGAALMVSGDTGPTHLAAAVGTPIVGLYGPTRPSRNGPWAAGDITISRYDACGCHHLRRCHRETMCLSDVDVAEVARAVDRRLTPEAARV